ncbi:TniQ family protein [Thalassomonas viridans]|uniref:TniQ family protein n=1 Tax=Thalassomonas viridans TaxID=137584 RepID=A0AAE9YZP1_9GAMM|nr:TniQ family protein [Thalassomonas viridans]WDE03873.1 TniQ family protein [Thalassomonas viridans]
MLTGNLWPAHPHPYKGECLSSWLLRCAHHNGLKAQTFCVRVFGNSRQVWNRDIDRQAPAWLLDKLIQKTATAPERAKQTTLALYEKKLFSERSLSGQLRWVTPLKIYHRKYTGYGMQYCPFCLAEDNEAYFRLAWRLAFYTYCPMHKVLMHDRCFSCGADVAYHRLELGKPAIYKVDSLSECWKCGENLKYTPVKPCNYWHAGTFNKWNTLLAIVNRGMMNSGAFKYGRLDIIHQLCKLIVSRRLAPTLQAYLCGKTRQPFINLVQSRLPFEQRDIAERHYVLGLAWWLRERWPGKLKEAVKLKALVCNELYRDLEDMKSKKYISQYFNL